MRDSLIVFLSICSSAVQMHWWSNVLMWLICTNNVSLCSYPTDLAIPAPLSQAPVQGLDTIIHMTPAEEVVERAAEAISEMTSLAESLTSKFGLFEDARKKMQTIQASCFMTIEKFSWTGIIFVIHQEKMKKNMWYFQEIYYTKHPKKSVCFRFLNKFFVRFEFSTRLKLESVLLSQEQLALVKKQLSGLTRIMGGESCTDETQEDEVIEYIPAEYGFDFPLESVDDVKRLETVIEQKNSKTKLVSICRKWKHITLFD